MSVVFTETGDTARRIARLHSRLKLMAFTTNTGEGPRDA